MNSMPKTEALRVPKDVARAVGVFWVSEDMTANSLKRNGQSCHFKRINWVFWLHLGLRLLPDLILKDFTPAYISDQTQFKLPPLPLLSHLSSAELHHIIKAMGIQKLRFPLLIFIIMLAISQLSSCRHIRQASEEAQQASKAEFEPRFSTHSSAPAPGEYGGDEIDPIYGVSHRSVPGGPNPLHNWLAFFANLMLLQLYRVFAVYSVNFVLFSLPKMYNTYKFEKECELF